MKVGIKSYLAELFQYPYFLDPFFHKKLYTAISSSEQVVELSDNIYECSELVSHRIVRLELE